MLVDYLREDLSRLDAFGNDNHSWIVNVGTYYQHSGGIIETMRQSTRRHDAFTARGHDQQPEETTLQHAERDGTRVFSVCLRKETEKDDTFDVEREVAL